MTLTPVYPLSVANTSRLVRLRWEMKFSHAVFIIPCRPYLGSHFSKP